MTHSKQQKLRLATLATERVDEQYRDLDRRTAREVLTALNDAEAQVPIAVSAVLDELALLVEAVAEGIRSGGRLVYVGAGTSGRLGVLDAAECPPTFHVSPETVQGLIAGGRGAVFTAVEGAEDSTEQGVADIERLGIQPEDTVVGIAASGRTPYVLAAVAAARKAGARTAGIACNTNSALGAAVDHPLEVEVGAEVIAGSTRLKAGSATKQLLNMLSTAVMVRIGKTYQNLMVDLAVTNAKLRDRGERLLVRITGCERAEAARALRAAGDRIPVAAVMIARQVDREAAEVLLASHGGRLAPILDGD
ncbi:N-acetylmuramic acid 6-phosphate etherase [Ruania zhangjianzhongii]|uniref:N-acetylmuramic acid 6-phosphate etherase n=1 Tax=Ruania zhangjianzhongii TaxID=2603206 RepID=UPI0011CC6402|nr:N-acetylmuramic acid 6-phosphate etherase [Ruania zhangjianzhongii]